jgi:hypothetical protein
MKPFFLVTLLSLVLVVSAEANVIGGRRLFKFQSKSDFRTFAVCGARWDAAASGFVFDSHGAKSDEDPFPYGTVESPDIEIGFPCDQIVVSWNSITPPGSYLTVYIQARSGGFWSRRFTVAIWNRDNRPVNRMSVNGQKDEIGGMEADILRLKMPADAFRVSAKLSSLDGRTYPTLRLLAAQALNSKDINVRMSPRKSVWGKDLTVPERSQLTIPQGNRFCSATSTAMVLDYWARKLGRPELSVPLQEAVDRIYDKEFGGTGNWPFNAAFAAEFGGLRAYVTRFAGIPMIEEWIAKGVPVIVSMDYNILRHRESQGKMGHLMVFRGFTKEGDCIINDPYTKLDKGESVRKIFTRADFEPSWLSNKAAMGTVYLIYPDGWGIPRNSYLQW